MAAKKTIKDQERTLPTISARIDRLVDYPESKVKAVASVNIADSYAIHGIKVIDSQKGLFVQMPQTSYEKDGKKQYTDQFHAITADARTALNDAVMDAYEQKLSEDQSESEALGEAEDELPVIGQTM